MPLIAEYSWKESDGHIEIQIPLKGISKSKVDVFVADLIIKVNFSPYFLMIDLLHPIDDENVTLKFISSELHLKCPKIKSQIWKELYLKAPKSQLKARRETAITEKTKRDEERRKAISDQLHATEKKTLRKQMALEEDERTRLDDLKEKEKVAAEEDVYKALENASKNERSDDSGGGITISAASASEDNCTPITHSETRREKATIASGKNMPNLSQEETVKLKSKLASRNKVTFYEKDIQNDSGGESDVSDATSRNDTSPLIFIEESHAQDTFTELDDELQYVPPPRQTGKITFKHTPRVFKTPMRESKRADEEDWVAKNGAHLRRQKMISGADSRDIGDRDPVWLKGKADEFYKRKDFRGAINAYTAALEADSSFLSAMGNRSACFLRLREHEKCIEDCSYILNQLHAKDFSNKTMVPPLTVESAKTLELRSLVRRGAALCQRGDYPSARTDYLEAKIIEPLNSAIKSDLCKVEQLMESGKEKQRGDTLFRSGDTEAAITAYTTALQRDPWYVSAISNRAACYLHCNMFESVISDCSLALELLIPLSNALSNPLENTSISNVLQCSKENMKSLTCTDKFPSGPIPVPSSDEFKSWIVKTLIRRGTAYVKLSDLRQAKGDYSAAFHIEPSNEEIAKDLSRIRQRLKSLGQL